MRVRAAFSLQQKKTPYDVNDVGGKGRGFVYDRPENGDDSSVCTLANQLWGKSRK